MKRIGLVLFMMASLAAPFAMAQSALPADGLLITRVNSEQWQIRLIANTANQQFSGVVQSDLPITNVRGLGVRSTQSAKLLTPTSLGALLTASTGGVDGVTFSASADAKLCLRNAGGSAIHVYLGNSLAEAVPVAAPVALTAIDACGDASAPVLGASNRKYNPGHYTVMVQNQDSQKDMATALQPGMVGIAKRYSWRTLEPKQGVYDFSEIKSDLAWAAANGTRLIVVIQYKTFNREKAGPAYLDSLDVPNNMHGYTLELWSPTVVARYNALVSALGAQIDSNRNFEGLGDQETALSLEPATLKSDGYSPEAYRDALISMLTASSKSLPTSQVFWFMNFLPGNQSYIDTIAAAVAPLGVTMSAPDVWPDNQSLQSAAYPYYSKFDGRMHMLGQVEHSDYNERHMTPGHATRDWTTLELYTFAVTQLHVNYMLWMRVPRPVNQAAYDWYDALPVIAAHRTFNP